MNSEPYETPDSFENNPLFGPLSARPPWRIELSELLKVHTKNNQTLRLTEQTQLLIKTIYNEANGVMLFALSIKSPVMEILRP